MKRSKGNSRVTEETFRPGLLLAKFDFFGKGSTVEVCGNRCGTGETPTLLLMVVYWTGQSLLAATALKNSSRNFFAQKP